MKNILPSGVLAQHIAVLGKTGSGKSSAMRLLVEGLLHDQKPVCIVDPKGDWYGLKSSADGKSPGYPVVIFGGDHADVPLNPHAGASVAELVATGNRPCIIDLGGWRVGERTRFWIDFASALFRTSRGPRHLVIDEVHNFAPQGKVIDVQAGEMLHWTNRLASEGRGKGITIISASQRPQKVHKDFLTCAETLIAMRVIHALDRNAVKEWIDGAGDPVKGREVLDTLALMKRGEGWVWSPEIGFGPQRVTFPMFSTYDSFKPQISETVTKLKGWAEVNLDDVKSKLSKVIEEKKANDPAELKRRIAELEKQIRTAPAAKAAAPVEKIVERPVIKSADVTRLEKVAERREAATEKLRVIVVEAEGGTAEIRAALKAFTDQVNTNQRATSFRPTATIQQVVDRVRKIEGLPAVTRNPRTVESDGTLGKCERSILAALKQRHPKRTSKTQAAILSGYSVSSGGFNNSLGKLRSMGLINGSGAAMEILEGGLELAVNVDPLPTGPELIEHWKRSLPKAEREILASLCHEYPHPLNKEQLGERTGYSPTSGGFNNALGKLRTLELINRGPEIRASSELFE